MIQNDNLAPDAKRVSASFVRDKSATTSSQALVHTHKQRYQITRITLEVLEACTTADALIYIAPFILSGSSPTPDTANAAVTITDDDAAPLATGVYNYGPGELPLSGVTFPVTLPADRSFAFYGVQASGAGAYIVNVDLIPLDDNPTELK